MNASGLLANRVVIVTGAEPFKNLLPRHGSQVIRMLLDSTHYRSPIHFCEEPLAELAMLDAMMLVLRELTGVLSLFLKAPQAKAGGADEGLMAKLMELVIEIRANARKAKDFATADLVRVSSCPAAAKRLYFRYENRCFNPRRCL